MQPVCAKKSAVSGQVGVKEIERLIKKLEFDKANLAEPDRLPDTSGGASNDA